MCLRWTITERFAAPDAMACPSARSRAPFITPGGRSARSSPSPSPVPTPGPTTDPPRSWGRSTRSSTRSWPTTSTPRPSSGTPPCRCSAASATSTAIPAVTARCNATCGGTGSRHQETFIPLGHLPGRRLEADFGHIHVDFPDGRRLVPFLVTTWAYSNAPFVLALPSERTEAILEGMVAAFEFFGSRPQGSLVGQSQDGRHVDPPGSRASAPPALRRAGQLTTPSTPVLHAGPGQREARRREHRQGRATPVRHPGAPASPISTN